MDQEQLAAIEQKLGLSGLEVGESVHVSAQIEHVGLGLQRRPTVDLPSLAAADFDQTVFRGTCIDVVEQMGWTMSVAEVPDTIVRLSTDDGSPARVHGAADAKHWMIDRQDPGTAFVDLDLAGGAVLSRTDGRGVWIRGPELTVTQLYLPLEGDPFVVAPPAVPSWLLSCSESWLAELVRSMTHSDDWLGWVQAAGMVKRLQQHTQSARQMCDAILAGVQVPSLAREHQWFRTLTAEQMASIEARATLLVLELLQELDATSSDDPGAWKTIAHSRDNLESIRVLLAEARQGHRLGRALRRLDVLAQAQIPSCVGLLDDPRLQRVSEMDPSAWWGSARP